MRICIKTGKYEGLNLFFCFGPLLTKKAGRPYPKGNSKNPADRKKNRNIVMLLQVKAGAYTEYYQQDAQGDECKDCFHVNRFRVNGTH